ncbi:hypothetical protein BGZ63DRAFT_54274 [Mariannaea sp. PMI_226]|nr:hypothetical protein BGZ63DRAFT_54274 [Mariannaea sp. PMI_226]
MWPSVNNATPQARSPTIASTPIFPPAALQCLPVPLQEPPQKRRRIENVKGFKDTKTRRRSLSDCLQEQVLPLVNEAVKELAPGSYNAQRITYQTIEAIARSAKFRTRLDETKGFLTPQDKAFISVQVYDQIKKLADFEFPKTSEPIVSSVETPLIQPLHSSSPHEEHDDDNTPGFSSGETETSPEPEVESRLGSTKPAIVNDEPPPQLREAPPRPGDWRLPYRLRKQQKSPKPSNRFAKLDHRPYLSAADRDALAKGALQPQTRIRSGDVSEPTVYHVDFTRDEIAQIARVIKRRKGVEVPATIPALAHRCRVLDIPSVVGGRVKGRSEKDIRNFCSDLVADKVALETEGRILFISQDTDDQRGQALRASRVSSLLLAREIEGNIGLGRMRELINFQNEFTKALEDELQVVAEFTNCAGDITAGSWVSNTSVFCGTTAHSDAHNQQYNKPGNLLLCSTIDGTLRSFPDHRIPRPRVEKGENATEAMRRSQDPWLYSSVVSSDYDEGQDLAFTSSFDKTVKVWKVDHAGRHMECLATWQHASNVNFVVAAKDGSGRVATAADSTSEAVRIYTINTDNIADSAYESFSCSRTDAEGSDKWAFFPATIQWGRAPGTQHLLLVGYSPRSIRGEDHDIPEDKRKSGEIALWDALERCRVPVMTASTANVFEVAWHPTLPRFIVATTHHNSAIEHEVRTQVHVFQREREREDGAYGTFQSLDCFAIDINELTYMPNSVNHAYVTAACTDGNVYIWDTAQGDKPIHILKHGHPLEEFYDDREREDTGVKFTAWGSSPDRFYTGSSDGTVRVWNVRNRRRPYVRNLLRAPGPISFGAFSPDRSKLAVGDATGRMFIFSLDKRDGHQKHFVNIPGTARQVRRPQPLIPHPEPPMPTPDPDVDSDDGEESSDSDIEAYTRRKYLDQRKLVISGNPVIGAVQGPEYASTGLFRRDAHLNDDPTLPLLADFERHQQESQLASCGSRRRNIRRAKIPAPPDQRQLAMHINNHRKDLNWADIPKDEMSQLIQDGALFSIDEDWGLTYEELPARLIDDESDGSSKDDDNDDDDNDNDP